MGNKSLTVRQQEVFDLLVRFYKERGYAPSNAELARMMGIASPTAAHLMLKALQRKGVITIAPGAHRGITINHQPKQQMIQVNLNSTVKLKLTDDAIAELKRQHDEMISDHTGLSLEFTPPAADVNGMVSMPLWSVMSHFGSLCYCGANHPFEMHLVLEDE